MTSVDAALVAVSTKSDGGFIVKEEQRTAAKASLGGKHILTLVLTSFGKSSVKNSSVPNADVGPSHP